MGSWTQVTINFEQSHLVFPTIIGTIVVSLGLAILVRDRKAIAQAPAFWRRTFHSMDRVRFFGTLGLTLAYFGLMVPIGDIWPNTGLGFLLCSVLFVFAVGALYLHDRSWRSMAPVAVLAVTAPPFAWWLFSYVFFLTLP